MDRVNFLASLVCGACAFCAVAGASPITPVVDQFDDGTLSPDWSVGFEDATAWTFAESGGSLTVTDISPSVVNATSGGTTARVLLSQTFTPLADFTASCAVAWDSEGSVNAMQGVGIQLFDGSGANVAGVDYCDAWVGHRGTRRWFFNGSPGNQGHSQLPLSGSASLGISRAGSAITVSWDGATLATGSSSSPIERVDLIFWYFAYDNVSFGTSFFGTESIDSVTITGNVVAVPEPSGTLLAAAGMACLGVAGLRRRPRDGGLA
jgi:hypothetical protein